MTVSTKEKILDAAEELFADRGFGVTSMRTITAEAGVNLAAIHYHFGSKEALIEAVFARRLAPLNAERLRLLEEAEAAAAAPRLEGVIEAFIGPALRMSHDPGGAMFMRLFGHTLSQPSAAIRDLFTRQFRDIVPRFIAALQRCLPDKPVADLFWRFLFMVGSMAHTMALAHDLPAISGGHCEDDGAEAIVARLVPFLAAGMRAPLPQQAGTDSGRAGRRPPSKNR